MRCETMGIGIFLRELWITFWSRAIVAESYANVSVRLVRNLRRKEKVAEIKERRWR